MTKRSKKGKNDWKVAENYLKETKNRSKLAKAGQNWQKGPKGVKKFCKSIDVKVLDWEESWIENDGKVERGVKKWKVVDKCLKR